MRISRRHLLAGAAATVAVGAALGGRAQPFAALAKTATATATTRAASTNGDPATAEMLNDASRLNPTPVARHVMIKSSGDEDAVTQWRALLKDAAAENAPVCVGGARHTMGGQSLVRGGFAGTVSGARCALDRAGGTYRIGAGARWREVVRALDPHGFSVAVMQSNNDFSVAGTLGANAHGWPVPFGPFGTTVRSFRMMLADGTVLNCSPSENAELFRLTIGGYGLFGIVLDVDLAMVPNELLVATFAPVPSSEFADRFGETVTDGSRLAYGRLDISRGNFLRDALLVAYRPVPDQPERLPQASASGAYQAMSRKMFRAQVGSETGKRARWYAETKIVPRGAFRPITRNSLMNYSVSGLADIDPQRTDILHEYFVPPAKFAEFLDACREIIGPAGLELLNVTLRHVAADPVSVLAYAPAPRIAAVMLFTQQMTAAAEAAMRTMTERLIDRVLALGGSYYLPYRLHARPDQFKSAYPGVDTFIAGKRRYDPNGRFRNTMWNHYMAEDARHYAR